MLDVSVLVLKINWISDRGRWNRCWCRTNVLSSWTFVFSVLSCLQMIVICSLLMPGWTLGFEVKRSELKSSLKLYIIGSLSNNFNRWATQRAAVSLSPKGKQPQSAQSRFTSGHVELKAKNIWGLHFYFTQFYKHSYSKSQWFLKVSTFLDYAWINFCLCA